MIKKSMILIFVCLVSWNSVFASASVQPTDYNLLRLDVYKDYNRNNEKDFNEPWVDGEGWLYIESVLRVNGVCTRSNVVAVTVTIYYDNLFVADVDYCYWIAVMDEDFVAGQTQDTIWNTSIVRPDVVNFQFPGDYFVWYLPLIAR